MIEPIIATPIFLMCINALFARLEFVRHHFIKGKLMEKSIEFLEIKTLAELASVLNIKQGTLNYYLKSGVDLISYKSFEIIKKDGGTRTIEAPFIQLKYIQKKIKQYLEKLYVPKKVTHGYVFGKSICTNAVPHVHKNVVLNVDIKDFFPSIHFGRVLGMFQKEPFNFNKIIAVALTKLVCYNGRLPQGAPTSPIISNIIARALDNDLIKLSSKYKLLYTRYCDDITISSKALTLPVNIWNEKEMLGDELVNVFKKNNFVINYSKVRISYKSSRQMVTGLVVNLKPNILNKRYRKFRTTLYYAKQYGMEEGAKKNNFLYSNGTPNIDKFRMFLQGTINYYKMVMGIYSSKYQSLATNFNELIGRTVFKVPDSIETLIKNNVYVVESDFGQGTGFYVKEVGLVTCLHNFCSIAKPIDEEELKKIIEYSYAILPHNKKTKYTFKLKEVNFSQDLLVLEMNYCDKSKGFEFASKNINFTPGRSVYKAIGYPGYTEDSDSMSIIEDIKITQERNQMGQKLYVVDKSFYAGASGGPVLDKNNKVVGVIDRGNEYGEREESYSAFCPIKCLQG